MKKCPFCAEEIQDDAVKCRFCNEFLIQKEEAKPKTKWYQRGWTIWVLFLSIGPFAIPFVWINPTYDLKKKTVITLIMLGVTYIMGALIAKSVSSIMEYFKFLNCSLG